MSVDAGLWKVLTSSVLATAGVVAVGLAAVPVLVPHPEPPVEPVNVVAPTPTSPVVQAPAGWTSAAEQYRAAQVQRAVVAVADELVTGSEFSEPEWLSTGGHLSRGVALPKRQVTEESRAKVDRQVAAVRAAVREAIVEQTTMGATAGAASTDAADAWGSSTYLWDDPSPTAQAQEPSEDPTRAQDPTSNPSPTSDPSPNNGADAKAEVKVRLAQANIYYDLSREAWLADYARVRALQPDFITLNEAAYRTDAELAVGGYAIRRSNDNSSTRETPVLWRTDRWTEIASGTRTLNNRPVRWGVRAVNWVTLKHLATGKVVSVISAHPAPTIPVTRGLLSEFMGGLSALVKELGASGPVFVGGDLNVQYQSAPYPAAALASAGLQATYDTLGRPEGGTGDHRGGIIDYMLYQPGKGVSADKQGKVEQASDHDTMWADFTLPH